MRLHTVTTFFLGFLFFFHGLAAGFEAEVRPKVIKQGDPFLLRVVYGPEDGQKGSPHAELNGVRLNFSGCGDGCYIALAAMGLETAPGVYTIEVALGKRRESMGLRVNEGSFPLQRLTLPEDKITLSPEDESRAQLEAIVLRALWPQVTERLWEGRFIMPLRNSFSTLFGVRRIINGTKKSIHTGLDIRGGMGEGIRAANRGRVVLAMDLLFGGNTLVLDHGQGVYTIYMHLSRFNTEPGRVVKRGDIIGFVGSTGRSTGPHLHYGVKINAVNASPLAVSMLPVRDLDSVSGPTPAPGREE